MDTSFTGTKIVSVAQPKFITGSTCQEMTAYNIVYENSLTEESLFDVSGVSQLHFRLTTDAGDVPLPLQNDLILLCSLYTV